jgi:hypothetical protein
MDTLTILSKNIWRLSKMSDTQHTPTDSEMLDWLFKNGFSIVNFGSGYFLYDVDNESCIEPSCNDPRAAIAAEMMKKKIL